MSDSNRLRPRFHFTPPRNWMNDPNGLIFHDGLWHLYYQHNPYGASWGHLSWGHAVSGDLVAWQHLPIALWEEPEVPRTIFSGSAVHDDSNCSGLGAADRPPLVAIYTADHRPRESQTIHLAASLDGGATFTKYAGNPVLDLGEAKFGDPKVFWHEPSRRWIMAVIAGRPQGRIGLYGSFDLLRWDHLSDFTAPAEAPGIWECPDLFPLSDHWILKTNHTPGASKAWVGDFDGVAFVPMGGAARPFDYGNCYAEVTYEGVPLADGRRILVGWIRQSASESRDWTGMQTIPRELSLAVGPDGPVVCAAPVRELARYRQLLDERPDWRGNRQQTWLAGAGLGALDLELIGENLNLWINYDDGSTARIRRTSEALEVEHGDQRVKAPILFAAPWLRLILDHGVIEAFAGQGEAVVTMLVEPAGVAVGVRLTGTPSVSRAVAHRLVKE